VLGGRTASDRFHVSRFTRSYHGMRVIKQYTVPPNASDAGAQQLRGLAELKKKQFQKVGGKRGKSDTSDEDCLEFHAKKAKLGRDAYQPSGTMWNAEYIAALILKSQGHSDAIPDGWLEPRTKQNKLPAQPLVASVPKPATSEPEATKAPTEESRWVICSMLGSNVQLLTSQLVATAIQGPPLPPPPLSTEALHWNLMTLAGKQIQLARSIQQRQPLQSLCLAAG